jgi:hypothetical protein
MKNDFEIRGDVTAVFLKRKDGTVLETLIDTADLPRVQEFPNTWFAQWNINTRSYYVFGNTRNEDGTRGRIALHRFLLNPSKDLQVDHINHDTLDNRRSNLRITTLPENLQNKRTYKNNRSSKFRNVHWHKKKQRWRVRIQINGKTKEFGYFSDLEAAKKVAIEARKKYMPFSREA